MSRSRSLPRFWHDSSFRRLITVGVMLVMEVCHATACDVCLRAPRVPFAAEHPAAIEVAVATQAAAELGNLDLNPFLHTALTLDRQLPPRLHEVSPIHLATLWSQTRPARKLVSLRLNLEILFVDTDRACRFDIRFGEVITGDSKGCPADVRLITTKAGFHRLVEKGFEHCEEQGLIAVDAEDDKFRNELMRLFSGLPPNGMI